MLSTGYLKKTSSAAPSSQPVVTADNLTVNGVSLTQTIAGLVLANAGQDVVEASLAASLSTYQPLLTTASSINIASMVGTNFQYSSTPTLSQTNQLTHKGYVDTSISSLKSATNTWSGQTNTFNNRAASGNVTPSLVMSNTSNGSSLNIIGSVGASSFNQTTQSQDNVICTAGQALSIVPLSTTASGIRISNQGVKMTGGSNSIVVDSSSNIIVTGTTSFSSNPTIASYTAPSSDTTLVPKKYITDACALKSTANAFTAQQSVSVSYSANNTLPSFTVANTANSTSVNVIPNAGALSFNNSVLAGDTAIVSEGASLDLVVHSNTSSGVRVYDRGVRLAGGSNAIQVDTSGNITTSGSVTFDTIPSLTSDLTSSYTNLTTQLASVGIVNRLIANANGNSTWSWGVNTTAYTSTTDAQYPYYLQAPILGTQTTTNSVGTYQTCYLNAPSGLVGPGNTTVQIQVSYSYSNGSIISGAYSGLSSAALPATGANLIKRATPFLASEFTAPNSAMVLSQSFFNLMMLPGSSGITPSKLNVNCPTSTYAIWTNSTNNNTNYSSSPKVFTNNYGSNSAAMTFNPIQFSVINQNKIQIRLGLPAQLNSPASAYWINQAAFSVQIVNGYDTASGTGWTISST